MKLYSVKYIGYSDEGAILVVAENEKEAVNRVGEMLDWQVYRCIPREVTEVDGYKVSIDKVEIRGIK